MTPSNQIEIRGDLTFHAVTQDGTCSPRVAEQSSQTEPNLVCSPFLELRG
jgi:hypothetical protein